jgi:hypothetical protein
VKLTPQQAEHLAAAAAGLVLLTGPEETLIRFRRLQKSGLLTEDGELTGAGRRVLLSHVMAGREINGFERAGNKIRLKTEKGINS